MKADHLRYHLGGWLAVPLLATIVCASSSLFAAPVAIPVSRDSDVEVHGIVNDAMGAGLPYSDMDADLTLIGHFVSTVMGSSTSPTGDHDVSSKAIQDSELVLGASDMFGPFLRGGRAAGSAFALHEIFGPTPGGGPAVANSFFDVFFTVPPLHTAHFHLEGTFEGHGDAEAVFQLNKLGMGGPISIFDEVAMDGAFTLTASAPLGPGTYQITLGAHADALPMGGSGAEYDFRFTTPEPASWLLGLLGLGGVWLFGRRMRR